VPTRPILATFDTDRRARRRNCLQHHVHSISRADPHTSTVTAKPSPAASRSPPFLPSRPTPQHSSRPSPALQHHVHLHSSRADPHISTRHGQAQPCSITFTSASMGEDDDIDRRNAGLTHCQSRLITHSGSTVSLAGCRRIWGPMPHPSSIHIASSSREPFCPDRPKPATWATAIGGCKIGPSGVAKPSRRVSAHSSRHHQAYRSAAADLASLVHSTMTCAER